MAKIKITQVVSRIGSTARQKKNLDALGIKKMGRTVVHEDSPIIMGMIEKVKHLVKVATVEGGAHKTAPKAKAKTTAVKTESKAAAKPAAKKVAKAKSTTETPEVVVVVTDKIPTTVVEAVVEEVVLEPVKED